MTVRNCAKWATIVVIGTALFVGMFFGSYGIYRLSFYKSWNDNAIPTCARVDAIEIINKTCQYNRNSFSKTLTKRSFEQSFEQSFKQCFDAYLNITFGKHHHRYNIFVNSTNYTLLLTELDECCIVGHMIRLYYNRNNPHDVSTKLHSMFLFWVVVIFTVVVAVICAVFVILVYRRETTPFDYQSLYNDPLLKDYE